MQDPQCSDTSYSNTSHKLTRSKSFPPQDLQEKLIAISFGLEASLGIETHVIISLIYISCELRTVSWIKNRHSTIFNICIRPQKCQGLLYKLHGRPWKLESPFSLSLLLVLISISSVACPWSCRGFPYSLYGRLYVALGWLRLPWYCSYALSFI